MAATDDDGADDASAAWMAWIRGMLGYAAGCWRLECTAKPIFGMRALTASAPAAGPDGRCWLRLRAEFESIDWPGWTGNWAANAVKGVPKPRVLDVREWDGMAPGGRRCWLRAELMTFLPGRPLQDMVTGEVLETPGETWWQALDGALATIRACPVGADRRNRFVDPVQVVGDTLGIQIAIRRWQPAHGDLHWGNVFCDPLGIVDWEAWGPHPAGTDEASLYLNALSNPTLADRTWERLAPVLSSEDGRVAMLILGAHLMRHVRDGQFARLAGPLPRRLRELGARLSV